jgi:hypothetical protein
MDKNKEWLSKEYLVQLIEKSINQDSEVQHDVMLPVLTSSTDAKRQCDIVIRTGNVPRQTITIVEVQSRNRKVEITTFDGWMSKMREVGAQHLICVSTLSFPESIKEKAKQSGNTVRLITLTRTGFERLPLDIFQVEMHYHKVKYNILSNDMFTIMTGKNQPILPPPFTTDDKIFRVNKSDELISLDNLIIEYIYRKNVQALCRLKVSLPPQKSYQLFMKIRGRYMKVFIKFDIQAKISKYMPKVSLYNYEQVNDGTLAWIFEGELNLPDKKVIVRLPAITSDDGTYTIRYMRVEYYFKV